MGIGTLRRYHEVRRPAGYKPAPEHEVPAAEPTPEVAPEPEQPKEEVKTKQAKRPKTAEPAEGQ